jgi:hypothetical protein
VPRCAQAYVRYCSSDAFAGDAAGAANASGFSAFAFRGQRIVAATLRALAAGVAPGAAAGVAPGAAALGAAPGHRLILGGCSAGARGALFTLDYSAECLPPGVALLGLLDSALWVDLPPLVPNAVSLAEQTRRVLALANATSRLGAACLAAYPAAADHWRCLFGEYRVPFLRVPYLLSASQADSFQLGVNLQAQPPYDATSLQRTFADGFQARVRTVLAALPTASQAEQGSAVFSSACYGHCTSHADALWALRVRGRSLRDALTALLRSGGNGTAAEARTVEGCVGGFDCGACGESALPPAPPAPAAALPMPPTPVAALSMPPVRLSAPPAPLRAPPGGGAARSGSGGAWRAVAAAAAAAASGALLLRCACRRGAAQTAARAAQPGGDGESSGVAKGTRRHTARPLEPA